MHKSLAKYNIILILLFVIYREKKHLEYLCTRGKLWEELRNTAMLLKVFNGIVGHICGVLWCNLEVLVHILVGLH